MGESTKARSKIPQAPFSSRSISIPFERVTFAEPVQIRHERVCPFG